MKKSCKTVAIIMSVILFFGIITPSFAQTNDSSKDLSSEVFNESLSSFSLINFYRFCYAFDKVMSFLTGDPVFGARKILKVYLDDELAALCHYISDNSVYNLYGILTEFPDFFEPARLIADSIDLDTEAFRTEAFALSDKLHSEGKKTAGDIMYFVGVYFSVVEECKIYIVSRNGKQEIALDVVYKDGGTQTMHPGIYVDTETGLFFGDDEKGMFGLGFNCSAYDLLVYAPINCWMRGFGFCVGYDLLAYSSSWYAYETHRYKFNYADKEWMVQLWKGVYIVTNGGEVGIYNRDPATAKGTYYDCMTDDQLFPMSLQIYHGDELLVNREMQPSWWINGFKLANEFYSPDELTVKATITMPNEEILDAFCESIDNSIYNDLTYTVDGLDISIVW